MELVSLIIIFDKLVDGEIWIICLFGERFVFIFW